MAEATEPSMPASARGAAPGAPAAREIMGQPGDALAPLHGAPLILMTVAIGLATFMEVLDMTIVNVSVPAISGSLGVSPNEATWTISSYSLAAAVMQPLTGWLGRRFGEVRTFCTCISLFIMLSAFCGLANSMSMLVIGRLLQGAISGPMVPLAQTLLMRNYEPRMRGAAMGIWAMVVFVAPIFGPILGGWITDNYSWPWIFYINVPIGAVAAITIWGVLRNRESQRLHVPIDAIGIGLLVIGVGALQFVLDNGNDKDWFDSNVIVIATVLAIIGIAFLIAWEWTDKHPVIDLRLFQHRNFRIGVLAICCGFFGFFGSTVIFPLWLQTTLGYTATRAGMATAPVGLIGLFLMPLIGRNMNRLNLRVVSTFGFLVFGVTMFWLSTMNQDASFMQLVMPRFWQGLGLSFFFLPLTTILLSDIMPDDIASASGLSNFLRTLSGSISTAVCVWLWTHRTDYHYAILAEHIQGTNWSSYSDTLRMHGVNGLNAFAQTSNLMISQGRTLAANDLYRIFSYLFWVLAPIVWLAKPPFTPRGGAGAH